MGTTVLEQITNLLDETLKLKIKEFCNVLLLIYSYSYNPFDAISRNKEFKQI